jgi:catechol 2,3-dioxygenase-like lactoylglutathione lyase family enzyme
MILGVHHIGLRSAADDGAAWLDHVGTQSEMWVTCPNVRFRLEPDANVTNGPVEKRPVNMPGIAHICLQSRDIEVGLARGVEGGLVPISGPVDLGTAFLYLYAHTRDGILLELEGAPFVTQTPADFWVGHVAFVAKDIVPLVQFYGQVLGLSPSPVSRLRPNPLYDRVMGRSGTDLSAMWLPGFNVGLEFWHYHHPVAEADTPAPKTGFTYICFESDDFEADVAHVLAKGGRAVASRDIDRPHDRTAWFEDPEDNCFCLLAVTDPNDLSSIANLPYPQILDHVAAQHPAAQTA